MKKIILVDASPRKNGNCEVMIDHLAKELSGHEVTVFKLREKVVHPCLACGACQGKDAPKCVQADDLSALIPQLEACDAVVLATPIYFNQMCAQAKMFLDRLYCFFNMAKPHMSNTGKFGKKAALLCTFWGGPAAEYAHYAEVSARNFFVLGAGQIKSRIFGGLGPAGIIANHPEDLKQVSELAQWLTQP